MLGNSDGVSRTNLNTKIASSTPVFMNEVVMANQHCHLSPLAFDVDSGCSI